MQPSQEDLERFLEKSKDRKKRYHESQSSKKKVYQKIHDAGGLSKTAQRMLFHDAIGNVITTPPGKVVPNLDEGLIIEAIDDDSDEKIYAAYMYLNSIQHLVEETISKMLKDYEENDGVNRQKILEQMKSLGYNSDIDEFEV